MYPRYRWSVAYIGFQFLLSPKLLSVSTGAISPLCRTKLAETKCVYRCWLSPSWWPVLQWDHLQRGEQF